VVQAVNGVSFDVLEGQTLGLVGESGSGKTTVGRCILRLTEPTRGTVLFKNKNITRMSQKAFRLLRPQMQMIFQDPYDSLDPRMTVEQIMGEPLRSFHGLSRAGIRQRVYDLAEKVGLRSELMGAYPHQLTGGQQQSVGIARALATDPALLVLDEPTSALDPYAHAEIVELLIHLQKKLGLAYLFISHDLSAVRHVSSDVAIMYLGSIIEMGSRDEIFASPQHPYGRALLSSVLYPDPAVRRPRKYALASEIPSPIELPPGCLLYSRCPFAQPACAESRPPLEDLGNGHWVACFRVTQKDALGHFDYFVER